MLNHLQQQQAIKGNICHRETGQIKFFPLPEKKLQAKMIWREHFYLAASTWKSSGTSFRLLTSCPALSSSCKYNLISNLKPAPLSLCLVTGKSLTGMSGDLPPRWSHLGFYSFHDNDFLDLELNCRSASKQHPCLGWLELGFQCWPISMEPKARMMMMTIKYSALYLQSIWWTLSQWLSHQWHNTNPGINYSCKNIVSYKIDNEVDRYICIYFAPKSPSSQDPQATVVKTIEPFYKVVLLWPRDKLVERYKWMLLKRVFVLFCFFNLQMAFWETQCLSSLLQGIWLETSSPTALPSQLFEIFALRHRGNWMWAL